MGSTSKMTDADLAAIATYLKDQPAEAATTGSAKGEPSAAKPPDDGVMKVGSAIYADECAACHGAGGAGVPGMFPTLKGAPAVQSTDPASLLRVVLRGARSARHRRGADRAGDAVVRLAPERRPGGRPGHLHPQCLGQQRAGGGRRECDENTTRAR